MSEPIAEAFVLIRPNMSVFSAEVQTKVASQLKTLGTTSAVTNAAAASQRSFGGAIKATTKTLQDQSTVAGQAARDIDRFSRGVAATGLSLFGLRGATLAASGAFLLGAAGVTAFAKAVGSAVSFQKQLSVFGATTGATAAELAQVRAEAIKLGGDFRLPGVSAQDAAEAMTELAKAGLSVQDAIAGARGVLQLGTAANISFAASTELVANAINAFGLSGSKATVVADTLANAANAAQGSIVDIGVAFGQAAAVGHQVGLSFQDTTVFLTALARAGLKSSDAGTSLRTALIRLINPTKKTKEIFKEFGIAVRDAQGNLRPEFFTDLGLALAQMTKKQRDATLAQIGGQDAVRANSILSKLSIKDLIQLRDELSKQGTAQKLAEARTVGLAGAGLNLQNMVSNLSIALGSRATPALTSFTNALTGALKGIAESPATGVLGSAIGGLADGFGKLAHAATSLPPVLAPVVGILSTIASVIGPEKILAVAVAFVTLRKALDSLVVSRILVNLGALGSTVAATGGRVAALSRSFSLLLPVTTITAARTAGAFQTVKTSAILAGEGIASIGPLITRALSTQIGIAAFAGGLFLILTRESSLERATRRLAEATKAYGDTVATLTADLQALANAQSAEKTDRLAVRTAKLAEAQARQALAAQFATASDFQREVLQNRLLVAIDNVRLAEKQVAIDVKNTGDAQKVTKNDEHERVLGLNKLIGQLHDVEAIEKKRGAIVSQERPNLGSAEVISQQKIIAELKKRAEAEKALGGIDHINNAERLEALAKLVTRTRDLSTTTTLLFRQKTLDAGLAAVEANFLASGNRAGANFVVGMRLALNPNFLQDMVRTALENLVKALTAGGELGGQSLAAAIARGFAARSQAIFAEVQAALAHAVTVASNQTDTLLARVTRVQIAGGSLQAQLAAAQAARASAQRELNRADAEVRASPGGKKRADAQADQRKALGDLSNADSEVRSLQEQIIAEAKAGADKVKADAQAAQQKLDDADQAFVNSIGVRQGLLFDIRSTRAERTKGLADDISIQVDLQAFFTRMIALAKKTIHSAITLATTLQQLRVAREQAITAQKQLEETRRENVKQAIIDKRDRHEESLNLDVQIAQTNHNKAQELKAHQALLKYLRFRQQHTTKGTLEWKRLQAKIAEENATIKDLKKTKDQQGDLLASAEFAFLQTQQGFAAQLLSNLIPAGIAARISGGSNASGPGGNLGAMPAPAGSGGTIDLASGAERGRPPDVQDVAGRLGRESATRTAARGASMTQMATLIHIQRGMLTVLMRLAGQNAHPEASHQRTVGRTDHAYQP